MKIPARFAMSAALTLSPAISQSAEAPAIHVALIAPITGKAAAYGARMTRAAQIVQDFINSQGGLLGRRLEVDPYDDSGDPVKATSAANDALRKHPIAIIGDGFTGTTAAAKAVAVEWGVPFEAFATGKSLTVPANWNVVRVLPSTTDYAARMAQEIYKQAQTQVDNAPIYFLHDGSDYGRSIAEDAKNFLRTDPRYQDMKQELRDGKISPDDNDFSALVTRVKASGSRLALVATGNVALSGQFLRQMGDGFAIVGDGVMTFPDFASIADQWAGQAVIVAVPGADRTRIFGDQKFEKLKQAFEDQQVRFGDVEAEIFASLSMLKQSVEKAGSFNPPAFMQAMHDGIFDMPQGPIAFDVDGNQKKPPLVTYRWINTGKDELRQIETANGPK